LKSHGPTLVTEDDFRLSSYDYSLPPELVAQAPLAARDASRLLVLHRRTGAIEHGRFTELPDRLRPGDLLVTNRSRVFPARLLGRREHGGKAEILLVRRRGGGLWNAMLRPGRRLRAGMSVDVGPGLRVQIEPDAPHAPLPEHAAPGAETVLRPVRLVTEGMTEEEALERYGHAPLPPYIRREDDPKDRERYQTVYAREPGSVAAPTAGLHFTPEVLSRLSARGVERAEIVLHVGPGTFRPVEVEDVRHHHVDPERVLIPEETAAAIEKARAEDRRVVAVGTTVTRTLESALDEDGRLLAGERETDLVIVPGYRFRVVGALVTNFHLPGSSLLLLACAFAGREPLLRTYREAVAERYRFYSYGDAMLIA
jgi:S-adenosylmethionine:tRNA ribosyltransferase-isomerase